MTIAEIAKIAGVSKTTVSRVINNKPDVNPETRDKILALIQESGFTPNAFAKAISSSKSYTIGLIIPYEAEYIFSNPFYIEVMRGISTQINERDYYLMLCYPKDHNYVNFYKQKRVDGFIIMSPGPKHINIIDELLEHKTPFISTASIPEADKLHYVDVDNYKGGQLVMEHLIGLGHRRIAYIGKQTLTSSMRRLDSYRDSLAHYRIPFDESLVLTASSGTIKSGYHIMEDLLGMPQPPTACFFSNDALAVGALNAVRDLGLTAPEDISVAGFDNISMAESSSPTLTTVNQPAFEKGYEAARLFIDYLERGIPLRNKLLDTELIVRKSTAPPKQR